MHKEIPVRFLFLKTLNVKKVAIDLTWVRPQKVGGTESCIRNLLDGISKINTNGISFV